MAGLLDVIMGNSGNPFAATNGSGSGTQASDTGYYPPAPQVAPPTMPTSQQSVSPFQRSAMGYSPLRDPEGPLARAGWIGALMATGPSRSDYEASVKEQKARQLGMVRSKAFQSLSKLVQEDGMTPQAAFLKFLNTPEGVDYIISDEDPQAGIAEFMKLAAPNPIAQERAAVFGGTPTPSAAVSPPGQPQNGNSGIDPNGNGAPVSVGNPLAGVDKSQLRIGAQRLAAMGDYEGANLALKMADGYDQLAKPPSTDELTEYDRYVAQSKEKGQTPVSWLEYKLQVAQAASPKPTTEQARENAQFQARVEVDKDAAKAAGEAAVGIQKALPVLDEIIRLGKDVPGGYKGALLPYLARAAESFGLKVDPAWDDAQVIQAMTQQLLPLVRQPGQVSNYEQQTYMNALPGLMQTQPGRIKIATILRRQGERALEVARVYRENLGSPELYTKLAELDKPIFSQEEIDEFTKIANAQGAGAGNGEQLGPQMATPRTVEEYRALPSGTRYMDPATNRPKIKK